MFSASFLIAGLALVAPTIVLGQKDSLFGPFDSLHQAIKGTMDNLPTSGVEWAYYTEVPQICRDLSQGWGVGEPDTGITCNGAIEAAEIKWDDCSESWILCRCQDANLDWGTFIDRVGRVPTGARSYVRTVIATQAPACSGLCFNGEAIRLHGDCDEFVLMHEVGHAVDDGYTEWQPFLDAYNADTCVPDDYGNVNLTEEFAQMFALVVSGWFSGFIPKDFTCLKNQFDVIWYDWRIQEALGSDQCVLRVKPNIRLAPNAPYKVVNVTIPSGLKSLAEANKILKKLE